MPLAELAPQTLDYGYEEEKTGDRIWQLLYNVSVVLQYRVVKRREY